jgi:hypothetical protein
VDKPERDVFEALFLCGTMELMVKEVVTHETLHRTAKYFMDSGRASSHEQALSILHGFGLYIEAGPEVATSRDHQVALLTLVNIARRTFLGGVHVVGATRSPLLVPLANAETVDRAVMLLGGKTVRRRLRDWPTALIGSVNARSIAEPSWRVTWDGWRGGVVPVRDGRHLQERSSGGLAPALAAAACAAEVFSVHAGDHPMAGRRAAGLSLWNPSADWLAEDDTEAQLAFLPSRLWLIGLGNLGQAYLWLLACLPYREPSDLELMLQDHDRLTRSNESTSVLTFQPMIGRMKTRALAEWLEDKGFRAMVEERRFGEWAYRAPHEPAVALCGVDNALARASLEVAGFGLIVEAGLGSGPQAFRNFSLHTFPSSLSAAQLWANDSIPDRLDISKMAAYQTSNHPHLDECGLAQLASRTVGVPFVSVTAAALGIAELLRRLNGGLGLELVSGSVSALEDVEISPVECGIYEFGHVAAVMPQEDLGQLDDRIKLACA